MFYVEYVPADCKSYDAAPTEAERALLDARIKALRAAYPLLFISFPGDEKDTGGCLAAGRGFFHINADGRAEPCPFSPFSDINVADHTLREALKSRLFARLQENDFLLGEHAGGCHLFEKRGRGGENAGGGLTDPLSQSGYGKAAQCRFFCAYDFCFINTLFRKLIVLH